MNNDTITKCPFLKDTTVRYCQVSPIRKLVPIDAIHEEDQRCLTNKYTSCEAACEHLNGLQELDRCPFLHTAVMSNCSASPAAKPVPKNNSVTSRCNSSAYLYCDTYLKMGNGANGRRKKDIDQLIIEGIEVPMHLAYSMNHMWLDAGEDGVIHVGVDAFLARVLGEVEQVQFNFGKNGKKPAVLLRTQGMDLYLVFPGHLEVTETNRLLAKNPRKLLEDPYGGGWLFESIPPPGFPSHPAPVSGLMGGKMAMDWMRDEITRMNGFIHDLPSRQCEGSERLAADGGTFHEGFAQFLDQRDFYYMHNMFFTANESHR